jgi:hypothetical protein
VLLPLTGAAGAAWASGVHPSGGSAPAGVTTLSAPVHAVPVSALKAQQNRHDEGVRRALRAFADAGLDRDDAAALARLWKLEDAHHAKVKAGRMLLKHLPIPRPSSVEPAPYCQKHPVLDPGLDEGVDQGAGQGAAVDAFYVAGYDYDDAVVLASYWNSGSPFDAMIRAGQKLVADVPLPIAHGADLTADQQRMADEGRALDAYFGAGYDSDDAITLARMWSLADSYDAKITAGQKLEAGFILPIRPGQS